MQLPTISDNRPTQKETRHKCSLGVPLAGNLIAWHSLVNCIEAFKVNVVSSVLATAFVTTTHNNKSRLTQIISSHQSEIKPKDTKKAKKSIGKSYRWCCTSQYSEVFTRHRLLPNVATRIEQLFPISRFNIQYSIYGCFIFGLNHFCTFNW